MSFQPFLSLFFGTSTIYQISPLICFLLQGARPPGILRRAWIGPYIHSGHALFDTGKATSGSSRWWGPCGVGSAYAVARSLCLCVFVMSRLPYVRPFSVSILEILELIPSVFVKWIGVGRGFRSWVVVVCIFHSLGGIRQCNSPRDGARLTRGHLLEIEYLGLRLHSRSEDDFMAVNYKL